MNSLSKFQFCEAVAKRIVDAYRNDAPEGCDPVCSYAAIAAAVIGAGTAAYGAYSSKKAGSDRAAQLQGGTKFFDPQQVDLASVLQNLIGTDTANLPGARALQNAGNTANFQQLKHFLGKIQPEFKPIQQQVGQNALSYSRGELPQDVISSIGRAAAERGVQSGYGFGSQGGRTGALASLNLRNLGLTSLDLSKYGTNLGLQVNQQAKSLLPNLGSAFDWLFTPAQGLQNAQFNTDWQNKATLANVSTGNAIGQNIADQQYAQSLNQAAMVQQAGSQLSGLLGQYAQNRSNQNLISGLSSSTAGGYSGPVAGSGMISGQDRLSAIGKLA